jgi:hypothetical protein
MRSRAALAAAFALTIGLSACGKYGPPERTVPRQQPVPPAAAEPESQAPEEETPAPAELDGAEARSESDQ